MARRRISWLTLTLLLLWSRAKVTRGLTPDPDGHDSSSDVAGSRHHQQKQERGRDGGDRGLELVIQVGRLLEVQLPALLEQTTSQTSCDTTQVTVQDLPPWLLHDRQQQLLRGVPTSSHVSRSSTLTLLCPAPNHTLQPLVSVTVRVEPLSPGGSPRSPSTVFPSGDSQSPPVVRSEMVSDFAQRRKKDMVNVDDFRDASSSLSSSKTRSGKDSGEDGVVHVETGQPAGKVNVFPDSQQCAQDYIAGLVLCRTPDQLNASHRVRVMKKSADFLSVHSDSLTWRTSSQGQLQFTSQGYTVESGGASGHGQCWEPVHSELSWTLGCSASRHVAEFARILQHNVQVGRIEREIGVELIGWYLAAKTPTLAHRRRRRQVENRTPVPTPTLYPPSATLLYSSAGDFTDTRSSSSMFPSLQRSIPTHQPSLAPSSTVSSQPVMSSSSSAVGAAASVQPTPSITQEQRLATGLQVAGFQMADISAYALSTAAASDAFSVTATSLQHPPSLPALQTSRSEASSEVLQLLSSSVTPTPELSTVSAEGSLIRDTTDSVSLQSSLYSSDDVHLTEQTVLSSMKNSSVSLSQLQTRDLVSLSESREISQAEEVTTSTLSLSSSEESVVFSGQPDRLHWLSSVSQLNSTGIMEISQLSPSVQSFPTSETSSFTQSASSSFSQELLGSEQNTFLFSSLTSSQRSQVQSSVPGEADDSSLLETVIFSTVPLMDPFQMSTVDMSKHMMETSLTAQEELVKSDVASMTSSDQIVSLYSEGMLSATEVTSSSVSLQVPQMQASSSVSVSSTALFLQDSFPFLSTAGVSSEPLEQWMSSSHFVVTDEHLQANSTEFVLSTGVTLTSDISSLVLQTSADQNHSVPVQTPALTSTRSVIDSTPLPPLLTDRSLWVTDEPTSTFMSMSDFSFSVDTTVDPSSGGEMSFSVNQTMPTPDLAQFMSSTLTPDLLLTSTQIVPSSVVLVRASAVLSTDSVNVSDTSADAASSFRFSEAVTVSSAQSRPEGIATLSYPAPVRESVMDSRSPEIVLGTTPFLPVTVSATLVDSLVLSLPDWDMKASTMVATSESDTVLTGPLSSPVMATSDRDVVSLTLPVTPSADTSISSVAASSPETGGAFGDTSSHLASVFGSLPPDTPASASTIVPSSSAPASASTMASQAVSTVAMTPPSTVHDTSSTGTTPSPSSPSPSSSSSSSPPPPSSSSTPSSSPSSSTPSSPSSSPPSSSTPSPSSPPPSSTPSSPSPPSSPTSSSPPPSSSTPSPPPPSSSPLSVTSSSSTTRSSVTSPTSTATSQTTTWTTVAATSPAMASTSLRGPTDGETTDLPVTTTPSSSTSTAPNSPPVVVNSTHYLSAHLGRYFEWHVPEGMFWDPEEGSTRSLNLSLTLSRTKQPVPPHFWVQFDPSRQMVYGLPLVADVDTGYHSVVITATDRAGLSASNVVNLYVNSSAFTLFTHRFVLKFGVEYSHVMARRERLMGLVRKLGSYFGHPSARFVTVTDVSVGSFLLSWTNSSLSGPHCPLLTIHAILNRMVRPDGTLRSAFRRHMGSSSSSSSSSPSSSSPLPLQSVRLLLEGACLLRPPPLTTSPTLNPDTDQSTSQVVTDIVLPVLIACLLLLLLVILLLFLLRCRRKKRGRSSLDTLEKELYVEDRGPVILPSELPEADLYNARPKKPVVLPSDQDHHPHPAPSLHARSPLKRHERYRMLGSQNGRRRPASYGFEEERSRHHHRHHHHHLLHPRQATRPVTVIFNNFDSVYAGLPSSSSSSRPQSACWAEGRVESSAKSAYVSTTSV